MKKLSAFLALILGILPISAMADSTEAGQKATINGNNAFTGYVTATNLNPLFVYISGGGPFNFNTGGNSAIPLSFTISNNQVLSGTVVNPSSPNVTFASIQITGFSTQCFPYNPNFIGDGNYPYAAETNGVAGGTITFHEYKPTGTAVTIGTLVLPNSPHGGPYINNASVVLATPYTPTEGGIIDAVVTSAGSPTQYYQSCQVTAVLQ